MNTIRVMIVCIMALFSTACSSHIMNMPTDETYIRLNVGSIQQLHDGTTRVDLFYRNINLYSVFVDTTRCSLDTRLLSTRSFRFSKVSYMDGNIRYFPEEPNALLDRFILHNYCY